MDGDLLVDTEGEGRYGCRKPPGSLREGFVAIISTHCSFSEGLRSKGTSKDIR